MCENPVVAPEAHGPSISADGRYVAFTANTRLGPRDHDFGSDIYVRDRSRGLTRQASVNSAGVDGNGSSYGPQISADGQTVAFTSSAKNLAPHTRPAPNVFLRDLVTRRTSRLHVYAGRELAAISAHGRYVSFSNPNEEPNGIKLWLRDRKRQTTQRLSSGFLIALATGDSLSANGRSATFFGFVPGSGYYVYDRVEGHGPRCDSESPITRGP